MNMREEVLHEIFLDIQNAYVALERDRCTNILEGYGVVPRALRFLWMYWGQLTMVAKAGVYYAHPIRGISWCNPGIPPAPHNL